MADFAPGELAALRAQKHADKLALGPGPALDVVAELTLAHPARPVRVRLLSNREPRGLLVYLHGGGWVMYDIDAWDRLGRRLAQASGWAVLLVDYALAPEHPYPTAVQQSWQVLNWIDGPDGRGWLSAQGLDADLPLAIGGDSAGGNLAAACTVRALAAGGPQLSAQLLIYPVLDSDLERPSYARPGFPEDIDHAEVARYWDLYCPDPARRVEPDAAPLRASSLAGSPPTMIVTAEGDVLNSEIEEFAARLVEQGVPVSRDHCAEIGHGFLSYWAEAEAAGRVLDSIAGWLGAQPARQGMLEEGPAGTKEARR